MPNATKVTANAALDSLRSPLAVGADLAQIFTAEGDDDDGGDGCGDADGARGGDDLARLSVDLTEEAGTKLDDCAVAHHDWIEKLGRTNREQTSVAYRRTADFRVSTTNLDATPMPQVDGGTHLGYEDHYVVDGSRVGIILAALVTPAAVHENQPAIATKGQAGFRWKLHPREVTGNTKYGTIENIVAIENEQIRTYFSPCRRSASGQGSSGTRLRVRLSGRSLSAPRRGNIARPVAVRHNPAAPPSARPARSGCSAPRRSEAGA